jgi:hypothetical protein
MLRVAVLDDYQRRAAGYADWDSLGSNVSEPAFRHMYGQVVQDVAAFRDGSPIRTLNDR